MKYETITQILKESKIPFAYYQFKDPPKSEKYIAYFETEKVQFYADNTVYDWAPSFAVELYTKTKDLEAEKILIDLFCKYEVPWSGGASNWIDTEKMLQTVFYC